MTNDVFADGNRHLPVYRRRRQTKLWEEHPEAMRLALSRHDTIADGVVTSNGGIVVKSRGEGDSLFMVFHKASDAVASAVELQLAHEAEPWLGAVEGLWEAGGVSVSAATRDDWESQLAVAREKLGDTACDELVSEGRRLSMQEAGPVHSL